MDAGIKNDDCIHIDEKLVSSLLPRSKVDAHKGNKGHLLSLAGSRGMFGAAIIAASGALRGGAGLVTAAVTASHYPIMVNSVPEALCVCLPDNECGALSTSHKIDFGRYSALLAGCGLSVNHFTAKLIEQLSAVSPPQVWDADALNIVATCHCQYPKTCVITPHPGEMGRLLGISAGEVQSDRLGCAKRYACDFQVVVLLKGHHTIIALPDGEAYLNPTGSPTLASAGMGDALSGIIGAFLARGLGPKDAAIAGAYIHGLAGESLCEGSTAMELVQALPKIISEL